MKLENVKNFCLKNRLVIFLITLSSLFLLNCFFKEVTYISFSLLIILICFDNFKNNVSYILFSLPFSFIFPFVSIIMYITAVLIALLKVFIIYIFKEKGKIDITALCLCVLFLIYCVLPIGEYNFNLLLKIGIFLIVFAALTCILLRPEDVRPKFNIKILAISIIISCLFGLANFGSTFLQSIDGAINLSGGLQRYYGLMHNANVLAMLCELTLSALAYVIVTNKFKLKDIILFVMLAVAGLFTFSKTYIIILTLITLILFIWGAVVNWKKTLLVFLIFASIVLIVYFVANDFVTTYVNRFIGTISNCKSFVDFMNMLTTTRYNLWVNASEYLKANPLVIFFGGGLGFHALPSIHNAYLSMISQLGIVGTLLMFGAIGYLIFKLLKKIKISKAIFIPILVLALIWMVEDTAFFIFFP